MTSSSPTQEPAASPAKSAAPASASSLTALIDRRADYPAISAYLDALSSDERLAQMLAVDHGRVSRLYDAVKGGPAVTLDDFFPKSIPDGVTLILEGRNSLPMFTHFQKRFCRRDGVVVGFNFQTMSFVTGPGYFVTTAGDDTHPGELLFDYTQEPPFIPEGWPAYKPNAKGLSRAVYYNMKDYCRSVATGVVVGAAFKGGAAQNAYFSLTRA